MSDSPPEPVRDIDRPPAGTKNAERHVDSLDTPAPPPTDDSQPTNPSR